MSTSTATPAADAASPPPSSNQPLLLWGLFAASVALLLFLFWDGLALMVKWWEREEYSHGYMIPLVALFIAWQRFNELPALMGRGAWFGLLVVAGGLGLLFLGELSAIYTLIQYGFLVALVGLVLCFFGWRGTAALWVALVYLVFMIPLPNFLYNNLSSELQLISSQIGVAVIRAFDISVYLEGNVIDLGVMKLQVVEACSGLRYLFPLMSFGFLIGYLYRGPWWQRAILFLSTIPITVLMNSARIGLIGVTVEYWGEEMAEGFLHDFEGWAVFMGCLAVLLLEIWIFQLFSRRGGSLWDRINLDMPSLKVGLRDFPLSWKRQLPLVISFAALLLMIPVFMSLSERAEVVPERTQFSTFPLFHEGWLGREAGLDADVEDELKVSDYMKANYQQGRDAIPVNLWIAYYDSQRKGASIHSPRSCIPGGGWRITSLTQRDIPGATHVSGEPLEVNRVVVKKGKSTQLVYYWFEGRERNVTNEYLAKWFIFWDSLTANRTHGALVRTVTWVPEADQIDEADERLSQYLRDFYPLLEDYVP